VDYFRFARHPPRIIGGVHETVVCTNQQWTASNVEVLVSSTGGYCSFAYSALASFRMGMSGSASFQRVRKAW
jgi:hypothetical protein